MSETCPFCGSPAVHTARGMYARTPPQPHAWCKSCSATGPRRDTDAEAISAFCAAAAAYARGIDEGVRLAKAHVRIEEARPFACDAECGAHWSDVDEAAAAAKGER